jgi:hypothetical protein
LLRVAGVNLQRGALVVFFGGAPLATLDEAGLLRGQSLALLSIPLGLTGGAAWLRSRIRHAAGEARPRPWRSLAAGAALFAAFLGEQWSASGQIDYARRELALPLYLRLVPPRAERRAFEVPATSTEDRRRLLDRIGPAARPVDVVFVLLESFRKDLQDPWLTPRISALGRAGLDYDEAHASAIFTPLAWDALFNDKPPYAAEVRPVREEAAAWTLEILKRAGYRVAASVSGDIGWLGYDRRILGAEGALERRFIAYPGHVRTRHLSDDRATAVLIEWLREPRRRAPLFALLQLDATHWDYYFDEASAAVRPFGVRGALDMLLPPTSPVPVALAHNRYKNAARHVDANVGRVVDALTSLGRLDDTALVVVSDHGEGFAPGRIGHTVLHRDTTHVPLILKLPGVPAARMPRLVGHEHVFPTLFAYLGIPGAREALRGKPALEHGAERGALLTFDGTRQLADLTLPGGVLRFAARVSGPRLTLWPVDAFDAAAAPAPDPEASFERAGWQATVRDLVAGRPR